MYLSRRFYLFILVIILLLCGGYRLGTLFLLGQIALAVLIFAVAMDFFLLYRTKGTGVSGNVLPVSRMEMITRYICAWKAAMLSLSGCRLSMRCLLYSSSVISVLNCLSEAVKGKRLPIICIPPAGDVWFRIHPCVCYYAYRTD